MSKVVAGTLPLNLHVILLVRRNRERVLLKMMVGGAKLRNKVTGVKFLMRHKLLQVDGEVVGHKMGDGEVAMNLFLVLNGTPIYPESREREDRRDRRKVVMFLRASFKHRSAKAREQS